MAKAKEARESEREAVRSDGESVKAKAGVDFLEEKLTPAAQSKEEETLLSRDTVEAAIQLVTQLADYAGRPDVLVLALPRGVPVALAVAEALRAPMDILLVRKLRVPGSEVLAMGAISIGGVRALYEDVVNRLQITRDTIEAVTARELRRLKRRERAYRGERPAPDVRGKVVILVSDGLTSGSTTRAAAATLRTQQPKQIIVAVPVAAPATCDEFRDLVDKIVCGGRA